MKGLMSEKISVKQVERCITCITAVIDAQDWVSDWRASKASRLSD